MAASEVAIGNLALQKLGAPRISSLLEDSRNARAINACYEHLRDKALRSHPWNFSVTRATLAATATAPVHGYNYAFRLPADCLRLLPPARSDLDWRVENHEGARAILTNDGASIDIRYIARIVDSTMFDESFTEMLACLIAWHTCEEITQSNQKQEAIIGAYRDARAEARRANAFESISDEPPEDSWLLARR